MGGVLQNLTTQLNDLFNTNLGAIIGLATVVIGGLLLAAGFLDKPEWRKRATGVLWGLLIGVFIIKAGLPLITQLVTAVGGGS